MGQHEEHELRRLNSTTNGLMSVIAAAHYASPEEKDQRSRAVGLLIWIGLAIFLLWMLFYAGASVINLLVNGKLEFKQAPSSISYWYRNKSLSIEKQRIVLMDQYGLSDDSGANAELQGYWLTEKAGPGSMGLHFKDGEVIVYEGLLKPHPHYAVIKRADEGINVYAGGVGDANMTRAQRLAELQKSDLSRLYRFHAMVNGKDTMTFSHPVWHTNEVKLWEYKLIRVTPAEFRKRNPKRTDKQYSEALINKMREDSRRDREASKSR